MKLYLSEFNHDQLTGRHLDYLRVALLKKALQDNGIEIIHYPDHQGYERIYEAIDSCDCVLCIVDKYWASSTWMATEATWGNGIGASESKKRDNPIPTFFYFIPEDYYCEFPSGYIGKAPGTYRLPADVTEAVCFIMKGGIPEK